MKNIHKTILVTLILAVIVISFASIVQLTGQDSLEISCSYFDPPLIDYLAFAIALFLIIEASIRIYEHKKDSLKRQSTRIIRILIGCSITTLHVIQFLHK